MRRGGRGRGPEAPEEDEEDVEAGEEVVDCAEKAGDAPWAPLEGGLGDFVVVVNGWMGIGLGEGWVVVFVVVWGVVWLDLSGRAPPEEESAWDQVGEVETGCA